MSRIEGDTFIIEPEESQQCDLCGRVAELRPYGPNGECVCFECGMKNPEAAREQFKKRLSVVNHIELKGLDDLTFQDGP